MTSRYGPVSPRRRSSGSRSARSTTPARSPSAALAALIAVGAVIIGSVSPWAHTALASANGTQGDGKFTLIAGVIAGVIALRSQGVRENPGRTAAVWIIVLGALIVIDGIGIYIDISGRTADVAGQLVHIEDTSWGIDLTILGGVGLVVTGWLLRRQRVA